MKKGVGAKKQGAPKKGAKKKGPPEKAEAGAKKEAEDVKMKEAATTEGGAKPVKAGKAKAGAKEAEDVAMKEAATAEGGAKPEKAGRAKKGGKGKKRGKDVPSWVGWMLKKRLEKETARAAEENKRAEKLRNAVARRYTYQQYHVVGRLKPAKPTSDREDQKLFRMKIWAKNRVAAKSKFWFFMKRLKRVKKANGQIISVTTIVPAKLAIGRNYGVWIRCQSRTGTHNMYKEYRDVAMNGAVEQMYAEMASRHRVRAPQIQIIRVAELNPSQCKRARVTQFHNSRICFPFVAKKSSYRPPLPHMKSLYSYTKPKITMY